ncbi:S1C family serine protease [Coraliomargarita parva]|uniref:S1C family serine protease n=1 Tax=Coraliomargarita parva TaxID=3014050 RepID=UPI0022B373C2|nr:S1C family serine protease [Coraliomargarita parva]
MTAKLPLLLGLLLAGLIRIHAAPPEQAVVQIVNYTQRPDWVEPWRFSRISGGLGSGFVIEGERILTNAHVVSWSKQLIVHRYQDPRPYRAEIEYIGHDCDLAVLKVADPQFFEGIEPLPIGELPEVRSTVTTYGYPTGGRQISYTRGVISRIEMQLYAHIYNRSFLAVQTDAAINPGNSGGPAIQNGQVVGVSFQGKPDLENAGFFIPPGIIRHFLEDIEDGQYDGFPDAGISTMSLINPAHRASLKLPQDDIGVRIDHLLHPFPETHQRLRENDVILAVSGYPVDSDGMIRYKGNRVHAAVLFDQIQHGEQISLKIWREGSEHTIDLPIYANREDRISGNQYHAPPYLLVGGLVFTELSSNYFGSLGRDWRKKVSPEVVYALHYRDIQSESIARSKPVVLSKILKHPSNLDFGISPGSVLKEVNGVEIHSMRDLQQALNASTDKFHRFRFLSGHEEALQIEAAQAADAALIRQYNIPATHRMEDDDA